MKEMTDGFSQTESDLRKLMDEWALTSGRALQSKQTGYLHLYYGGEQETSAQTIPTLENTLFVLSLFHSRTVEQVQEGKAMLRRLFAFQNRDGGVDHGNFPTYLHQYPECHDSALSVQLLAPLYWILKPFGHVLGAPLKQELEEVVRLAMEHALRSHQEKAFPYSLAVRLAAAEYAYGLLWSIDQWRVEGANKLIELAKEQLDRWQATKQLGDILAGLQMVYPSISQSIWSPLWNRMDATWHPKLACYIGPCVREWQERSEPRAALYDLFGGFFSRSFSNRATLPGPHHLHGLLIRQSEDRFSEKENISCEGALKEQAWRCVGDRDMAYTLLEKKGPFQPTVDKTHTPFRMVWGGAPCLHSLVCQGGNVEQVSFEAGQGLIRLLVELREERVEHEVEFFVDFHPDVRFYVDGQIANTFRLGEELTMEFQGHRLSCRFDLKEGEGDFTGHVMRGNRPSQLDDKGHNRFQSYDWTFFLRSLRREKRCLIQITMTLC